MDASRMKIALVTDAWFPQINGVVTTLSHVREELEAQGHVFEVIHPGLFRTIPCPKYPEIRLSLFPGRTVKRLLREANADAIHIATEGPLGLSAWRYCKRKRLPFTTSYHTQFALYLKKYIGLPTSLGYRGLRWFHNRAERTLVPTPSIKRELTGHGFTNIITWTRGVNTELFRPYGKEPYAHLPKPVFVYCGRVAIEKNIEAFLGCDLPGSKVVIGDGPAMASMRAKFPNAHYLGFKKGEDLARHVAAGDVFVFPSRTDTFGVVMLEAMGGGLPVAAYPVTGPIDVVRQGVTGALHEDLRTACLEALKMNPEDCRAQAVEFSWKRCAEMFLENLAPSHDHDAADADAAVENAPKAEPANSGA